MTTIKMVFDVGQLFLWWETLGVFDYVLPFLLIFSIVYGILIGTGVLSNNKGVNLIISIVIGLLTLRLDYVQRFFIEIFPRMGVGIAVLFVLLIFIGLFIPREKSLYVMWILFAIGAIIAVIVIAGSFGAVGGFWGGIDFYEGDLIKWVVSGALLVGIIVAVAVSTGSEGNDAVGNRQLFIGEK